MHYITISKGLLEDKHIRKMRLGRKTSCNWVYLWILDKVTSIDKVTGFGAVLGGKPVKVEELAQFGDRKTVMAVLKHLEEEEYITTVRTPYGKSIYVNKAKKQFGLDVDRNRSTKSGIPYTQSGTSGTESGTSEGRNLVHLGTKSGTSNKTIQLDNTVNTSSAAEAARVDRSKSTVEVIDSFEKVNPAFRRWYALKAQRDAIGRMLDVHGKDRMLKVIALLPQTNRIPYLPTVTTPVQLEDKWAALAAGLVKEKEKNLAKKTKVAFA